ERSPQSSALSKPCRVPHRLDSPCLLGLFEILAVEFVCYEFVGNFAGGDSFIFDNHGKFKTAFFFIKENQRDGPLGMINNREKIICERDRIGYALFRLYEFRFRDKFTVFDLPSVDRLSGKRSRTDERGNSQINRTPFEWHLEDIMNESPRAMILYRHRKWLRMDFDTFARPILKNRIKIMHCSAAFAVPRI